MARFLPNYMKGFFSVLRLFCQFPLRISAKKVETSYFFAFYSLVIGVLYVGVFLYAYLWGNRSTMGIVYSSNPIFGFMSLSNMVIPMFVIPVVNSKFLIEFFKDLFVIDTYLESLGAEISYRRHKIMSCGVLAVLFCLYVIIKCVDLIFPAFPDTSLMIHFSHAYGLLVIILTANIVSSTMLIQSRFQYTNQQISSLFKNDKTTLENVFQKFRACQRLHCQLCQMCLKLSAYFKLAVLFTLANLCGALLTSLLAAFADGRLKTAVGLMSATKWHLFDVTALVGLLLPFDLLQAEANKTGQVLHEAVLDTRADFNEIQVNTFSLQLIHHKIVFSTGLFNISMKIALPAASVIATYLVIFVQFSTQESSVAWEPQLLHQPVNRSDYSVKL